MNDIAPETTIVDTVPAVPKSCRWRCVLPWLIVVMLLIMLFASLLPWFMPRLALMTPLGRQLQDDRAAIAALHNHPVAVAVAPVPVPAPAAAPADETRLAALESQLQAVTAAQQANENTETRIHEDSVKAGATAAVSATRPLLLTGTIAARLAGGLAYTAELEALSSDIGATERSALEPLAKGSDTPAQLAQQVERQERTLAASYRESIANDWWEKIKARLSRLILIRVPGSAGDSVLADLDALVRQIAHDDIDGALSTIGKLPQPVAAGLDDVRGKLTARKAAQNALRDIAARTGAPAEAQP